MTPASYATVSWDQLHRDARDLARRLIGAAAGGDAPFRGIVAISRGGLIPAAIIARELDCRLVESVCILAYDDEMLREPTVLKAPSAAGDGEGFLIVDDLVDTGVTGSMVRRMLPRAVFACLYAKPAGRAVADHYVAEVAQETWVLFPWDTAPLFVAPLARQP